MNNLTIAASFNIFMMNAIQVVFQNSVGKVYVITSIIQYDKLLLLMKYVYAV